MTDPRCANCSLDGIGRHNYVPGVGPEHAKIAFLGEAPGREEVRKREPFVGESGRLLTATLKQLGIKREDVYYTNVVKCWPPGNAKPTKRQVECCAGAALVAELKARGVVTVVALGNTALEEMLGVTGITKFRGHVQVTQDGFTVIPTFHPAAILRNDSYFPDFVKDLKLLTEPARPSSEPPGPVVVLDDEDEFIEFLNSLAGPVVIDIETSGYDLFDDFILCMVFARPPSNLVVVTGEVLYDERVQHALRTIMNDRTRGIKWIGHNLQYDVCFLQTQFKARPRIAFDTLLAHYALDERKGTHDLKQLAAELLGAPDWESDLGRYLEHPKRDSYARLPRKVLYRYNALDGYYTLQLYKRFEQQLIEESVDGDLLRLFYDLLIPATNALVDLTVDGIKIDYYTLAELQLQGEEAAERATERLREITGNPDFNPLSPAQVREYLYERLKAPTVDRSMVRGVPPELTAPAGLAHSRPDTTAMFQLERLTYLGGEIAEFAKLLIERRKAKQLVSTYLANYAPLKDGRIHPSYMLFGTVTGRLASTRPNVLNMPHTGGIRRMIVPQEGSVILVCDYSQNELRVLATLSGAPGLCEIYSKGLDLHDEVCRWFYGADYSPKERMIVKSFNFGLVYGRSAKSIAEAFGLEVWDAQQRMTTLLDRMGIREWRNQQARKVAEQGYIGAPFGRRRRFPLITERNVAEVSRQAINAPIQGTGSDLMLASLIEVNKWIHDYGARILFPVHDSLVVEVPAEHAREVARRVREIMVEVPRKYLNAKVPWVVDLKWGASYDEHDLKVLEF